MKSEYSTEKKKEIEKCLEEILEHRAIKFGFPEIDTFRGLVEKEAKRIIDHYLQREPRNRFQPSTIAGASVYLACKYLFEQGKIPRRIAQADAANAASRAEKNIRFAVKRMQRSLEYLP